MNCYFQYKKRTPLAALVILAGLLLLCLPLNAALVNHWAFDGNACDSGAGGNNGTVNGATLTAGKFGCAYSFDGMNDEILICGYKGITGMASRTISAWVNTNGSFSCGDHGGVIGWGSGAASTVFDSPSPSCLRP